MRVSLGQISSSDDKVANLAVIGEQVASAAAHGSDLVVFPEFAMYDLPAPDLRFVTEAEDLDGPFVTALQRLAAEHDVTIVAGMLERVEGGERASNTLVAISPAGSVVGIYRKMHLYDAFGARESDLIRPSSADAPSLIEVAGITVGLETCYDLRFPESTRELVDAGADLVLLPASWVPGPRKEEHWRVLSQARAIENTIYFAAVGQAPPAAAGGSLFIDPMGVIVGDLGETVNLQTFDVDPARIAGVRAKNPCLVNRRFAVSRKES